MVKPRKKLIGVKSKEHWQMNNQKLKKRLIVSGFPCSEKAWLNFFKGDAENITVTFFDYIQNLKKADFKLMAKHVASIIEKNNPDYIVCHDFGVVVTLLALLRLKRKNVTLKSKLTIFNGALRGFDVFYATHPFKIQIFNWQQVVNLATRGGASHVDTRLASYLPMIKSLYFKVIFFSLLEKVKNIFSTQQFNFDLGIDAQIIASENDPFIPFCAMEFIAQDFSIKNFNIENYGHFPYTGNKENILNLVHSFERGINHQM